MATYYGTGRSNYVKVRNDEAFEDFIENFDSLEIIRDDEGRYGLLSDDENGEYPQYFFDEEQGVEIWEYDFIQEISKYLVDEPDNIFVWMSAGHEKMRYVSGFSVAVNAKGNVTALGLEDIYNKCKKELSFEPSTRAEY